MFASFQAKYALLATDLYCDNSEHKSTNRKDDFKHESRRQAP
jgi:hypothetical protein